MSRRRYLSSDISTDPKIADLAEYGTLPLLLYTWAIPHLDDWGRMIGEARQFKMLVCPCLDTTVKEIDVALNQIASVGLWDRYEAEGRLYIAVHSKSWFNIQSYINQKKRDADGSKIPAPKNAEEQRRTPNNSEERRESPQNTVIPTPSLTPSLTPTSTEMRSNARARDVEPKTANEDEQTSEQSDEAYIQPEPTEQEASPAVASLVTYCHTHKIKHAPNLYVGLEDHLTALCDKHPPVWVERALKITAGYGRKSLSYAEAILRGWVADGGPPEEPENVTRGRGKRDGANRTEDLESERPPTDGELYRRFKAERAAQNTS